MGLRLGVRAGGPTKLYTPLSRKKFPMSGYRSWITHFSNLMCDN